MSEPICKRCGKHLEGKQKIYCSYRCKNTDLNKERRRRNKQIVLDMLGNKCSICGYNKCPAALEFHHPNDDKEFGISKNWNSKNLDKVIIEAKKCVLLCSNCHKEIHYI